MDNHELAENIAFQIIDIVQHQRLAERAECVLKQNIKASEERRALFESATVLDESVRTILDCTQQSLSARNVKTIRHELERGREQFARQTQRTLETDLKLGALEEDLLTSIRNIQTALQAANGAAAQDMDRGPLVSGEGSTGCATDQDNENLDPLLLRYFNRTADVSEIEKRIHDLETIHKDILSRRERLLDQDMPLPDSDAEFLRTFGTEISTLERSLVDARLDCANLEAECATHSLDVEQVRWRDRSGSTTKPKANAEVPNTSARFVDAWLEVVNDTGPEAPCTPAVVTSIPLSAEVMQEHHLDDASSLSGDTLKGDVSQEDNVFTCKSFSDESARVDGLSKEDISVEDNQNHLGNSLPKTAEEQYSHRRLQTNPNSESRDSVQQPGPHPPALARKFMRATTYNDTDIDQLQDYLVHDFECNQGLKRRCGPFRAGTVLKIPAEYLEGVNSDACEDTEITEFPVGFAESGAPAFRRYRWFLAIRVGQTSTVCLRITTNGGRGAMASPCRGHAGDYSIIYTGKCPPNPQPEEEQGTKFWPAVRINQDQQKHKLSDLHRLHWNMLYEIPNDVEAFIFGKVHPQAKDVFRHVFRSVAADNVSKHSSVMPSRAVEGQSATSGTSIANQVQEQPSGRMSTHFGLEDPALEVSKDPVHDRTLPNSFNPGQIVELTIDRGTISQQRQFRRLVVSRKRWHDGKWQYILCDFRNHYAGLFADGEWVDGNEWLRPAKPISEEKKNGARR